jgi:hypothetical protein
MRLRIASASLIGQGRHGEQPTARAYQIAALDPRGMTQTVWARDVPDLDDLIDFIDRHGRIAIVDYGWTDLDGERMFDAVIWEEGESSPFNY